MDANGSRFHALLGRADWRQCRASASALDLEQAPHVLSEAQDLVEVDALDEALVLRGLPYTFPQSSAVATRLPLDARRGAAFDRFGNTYFIADEKTFVQVRSAGTGRVTRWWPLDEPESKPAIARTFSNIKASSAPSSTPLKGLAVTRDHRLVVGTAGPAGWWVFDLFSGGPPRQLLWPNHAPLLDIADMSAAPDGGVWLLDAVNRRVWRLGPDLLPSRPTQPAAIWPPAHSPTRLFGPRGQVARPLPLPLIAVAPIDLPVPGKPVAIEALDDGRALVLLHDSGGGSSLLLLHDGAVTQTLAIKRADDTSFLAHDMASVRMSGGSASAAEGETSASKGPSRIALFVADDIGNQAHRFDIELPSAGAATLRSVESFWPMRRFGGRALLSHGQQVLYDFGPGRWVPLVEQLRKRFEPEAWVLTPVFDSGAAATQWHRLMLDANFEHGTRVAIASRASDDLDALTHQTWDAEPAPYRRGDGRELPYLPLPSALATWELLLQEARGRFLQLRLHLQCHLGRSPRVHALRVYSPRFSYLKNYLPAVYREDAASAMFLDGFLANVEGLFTSMEDRIAHAQVLFDWRTAPPDALDWLAGWLGLATEQQWPATRKRRFIRHAMRLYRWRGTVHGLRIALALALDDHDESDFDNPARADQRGLGVRVIEAFRTRRVPDVLLGDPSQPMPPPALASQPPWRPADGVGALLLRWRRWSGDTGAITLPLAAPVDELRATEWRNFCEAVLGFEPRGAALELGGWREYLAASLVDIEDLNQQWNTAYLEFGEVPLPIDAWNDGHAANLWRDYLCADSPASESRRAWQQFLRARYMSTALLNRAWATRWTTFDIIPLPGELPASPVALADWFQFEGQVLAMHATAHRFTVLLPMPEGEQVLPGDAERLMERARRAIEQEKPAHTHFTLRLYWAMFRVGEARLGLDTRLDGSVRERLLQPAVLGQAWLGETWLPMPPALADGRALAGQTRLASQGLQ